MVMALLHACGYVLSGADAAATTLQRRGSGGRRGGGAAAAGSGWSARPSCPRYDDDGWHPAGAACARAGRAAVACRCHRAVGGVLRTREEPEPRPPGRRWDGARSGGRLTRGLHAPVFGCPGSVHHDRRFPRVPGHRPRERAVRLGARCSHGAHTRACTHACSADGQ
jgi:hypothetical protein